MVHWVFCRFSSFTKTVPVTEGSLNLYQREKRWTQVALRTLYYEQCTRWLGFSQWTKHQSQCSSHNFWLSTVSRSTGAASTYFDPLEQRTFGFMISQAYYRSRCEPRHTKFARTNFSSVLATLSRRQRSQYVTLLNCLNFHDCRLILTASQPCDIDPQPVNQMTAVYLGFESVNLIDCKCCLKAS